MIPTPEDDGVAIDGEDEGTVAVVEAVVGTAVTANLGVADGGAVETAAAGTVVDPVVAIDVEATVVTGAALLEEFEVSYRGLMLPPTFVLVF